MPKIADLIADGVLEVNDGYRTKQAELSSEGFRILRAGDVQDFIVRLDGVGDYVSADFIRQMGRKVGRPGDVVITTKGTVGRVAMIGELSEEVVYSPQISYFRVLDETVLDPRYLMYWLKSPRFLHQLGTRMFSTDMAPYISLRDMRSVDLPVPLLSQQQMLVGPLSCLESKFLLNDLSVDVSRRLMRMDYSAVPSERREVLPLSSLAEFVNGGAYTKHSSGVGRVVIRIAELNSGISASTVWSDIEVPERNLARRGDILMSWSGSVGIFRWFGEEAIINQHIFKVTPRKNRADWLVYMAIEDKLDDFRRIAADKATTMGHIKRKDLDSEVSVPIGNVCAEFDPRMSALWDWSLSLRRENLRLAQLRDLLLPILMDGTLNVRAAEDLISGAV